MQERAGYSRLQIGLHWLIAVLILGNWFLGDGMGQAVRENKIGATGAPGNWHVWIGVTVLVLVLLRFAVRLLRGAPVPPGQPGSLAVRVAGWGHAALYILMIGVPLGGALVWYQGITSLGDIHGLAGNVLFFLALGHALMALYHHYLLKDGVVARMMRPE